MGIQTRDRHLKFPVIATVIENYQAQSKYVYFNGIEPINLAVLHGQVSSEQIALNQIIDTPAGRE